MIDFPLAITLSQVQAVDKIYTQTRGIYPPLFFVEDSSIFLNWGKT